MTDDLPPATGPVPAHGGPFVPLGFVPPEPPRNPTFWLEPLGPQHNDADYAAWMSSIEHIRATPGFPDGEWPHEMPLEENLGDLVMHADHFARNVGFTYTVRSSDDSDVIGCVYIYPSHDADKDADVKSWVRASKAERDTELWTTVNDWLVAEWPFRPDRIEYLARS